MFGRLKNNVWLAHVSPGSIERPEGVASDLIMYVSDGSVWVVYDPHPSAPNRPPWTVHYDGLWSNRPLPERYSSRDDAVLDAEQYLPNRTPF